MDFLILFSRLPSCFGHLSTNHDRVRNAVHVPRVDSADHQLVPPAGLPGQQDRHLWFLHWPLPCPAVLHRQLGMGGVHHRRQNCGVHYTGELVDWGCDGVGWGGVGWGGRSSPPSAKLWHSLYGWVSRLGVWWGGVGWGWVGGVHHHWQNCGVHYTGELVDWGCDGVGWGGVGLGGRSSPPSAKLWCSLYGWVSRLGVWWGGVGWGGVGGVHKTGVHYMGELVDWGCNGVGWGVGGRSSPPSAKLWHSLYGWVTK